MKLPKHLVLHISHNEHETNYWDVSDEIHVRGFDFRNEGQKQRCIDTNELWEMQWYPDTPIGFHLIAAPTLEELLEYSIEGEFD